MIDLLVALIIFGVVLYLIHLIPMDGTIRQVIRVVLILFVVLWLLQWLGWWAFPLGMRGPRAVP